MNTQLEKDFAFWVELPTKAEQGHSILFDFLIPQLDTLHAIEALALMPVTLSDLTKAQWDNPTPIIQAAPQIHFYQSDEFQELCRALEGESDLPVLFRSEVSLSDINALPSSLSRVALVGGFGEEVLEAIQRSVRPKLYGLSCERGRLSRSIEGLQDFLLLLKICAFEEGALLPANLQAGGHYSSQTLRLPGLLTDYDYDEKFAQTIQACKERRCLPHLFRRSVQSKPKQTVKQNPQNDLALDSANKLPSNWLKPTMRVSGQSDPNSAEGILAFQRSQHEDPFSIVESLAAFYFNTYLVDLVSNGGKVLNHLKLPEIEHLLREILEARSFEHPESGKKAQAAELLSKYYESH